MIFINSRIKCYKVNSCDMLKKQKDTTFQTVTHSVFKMALELEKNRAD